MHYFCGLSLVLFCYMNSWFLFSLVKKRNDVADTAWGLGFILLSWISFFLGNSKGIHGLLVGSLISIWGIRLAWHIHSRNQNKPEDYRYAQWREQWGRWFYIRSYFQVFILQGTLLFVVSLPILLINQDYTHRFNIIDLIGIAVWALGFFFEIISDAQLANFINNPANKGKILQKGMWQYSRHPNYFGEVTMWWGIWLIALPVPFGFLSIIGPITITFLILKVSGIPLIEKKMENNPQFAAYKKRTSAFIPLPQKFFSSDENADQST